MKKLEKELYEKHAKRLEAIININSTFVPYLKRPDFNNAIKTQLNILAICEKKFPKAKLAKKYSSQALVDTLNQITKDTFQVNPNYKYEDDTDLIDSINYLYTFCNNMFRVNLDDLVAGKQITATDPKIDLRAKAEWDDEGKKISPNFAFAGGIPLASTPYENPYFVGKAYAKLTDDMKQGKFYRFTSKPKIVLIAKWIIAALMVLSVLALITTSVLAFMAADLKLQNAEGEMRTMNDAGAIGSGVLYIFVALFSIYPIYILLRGLLSKNLNTKYYFSSGLIITFIILTAIIIMPDMRITWLLEKTGFQITEKAGQAYVAFIGWKIMYVVTLGIIGASIIPMVLASIMNPKPDTAAVDAKIKEYIDMFTAESVQSPVPPSADKQTPQEDKKTKK